MKFLWSVKTSLKNFSMSYYLTQVWPTSQTSYCSRLNCYSKLPRETVEMM